MVLPRGIRATILYTLSEKRLRFAFFILLQYCPDRLPVAAVVAIFRRGGQRLAVGAFFKFLEHTFDPIGRALVGYQRYLELELPVERRAVFGGVGVHPVARV